MTIDILIEILQYLDKNELEKCQLVCLKWYDLVDRNKTYDLTLPNKKFTQKRRLYLVEIGTEFHHIRHCSFFNIKYTGLNGVVKEIQVFGDDYPLLQEFYHSYIHRFKVRENYNNMEKIRTLIDSLWPKQKIVVSDFVGNVFANQNSFNVVFEVIDDVELRTKVALDELHGQREYIRLRNL